MVNPVSGVAAHCDSSDVLSEIVAPEDPPKLSRYSDSSKKEDKTLFGPLSLDFNHASVSASAVVDRWVFWVGHVLLLGFVVVLLVRLWHVITPECWSWLKNEQLKGIDHLLLGLLGGLVARFFPSLKDHFPRE